MTRRQEAKILLRPWTRPLRKWQVRDNAGTEHVIDAHFCFNNDGEGLVFRTYMKGNDKTMVVAAFNTNGWEFYKELPNG